MARVVALSSQVAWGHIGNSAGVFTLQRLGHDVCALPTVLLSNRPGLPHLSGAAVAPDDLCTMIAALAQNGWLATIDLILTGYLPTPGHVDLAVHLIETVRGERRDGNQVRVVCDPVMGDDPKGLYIDHAAAERLGAKLIGCADVITPNRFELALLGQQAVSDQATAQVAAARLNCRAVVATSIPDPDGGPAPRLLNLLLPGGGGLSTLQSSRFPVPFRGAVPNGTGDFFAALLAGLWLHGLQLPEAVAAAATCVDAAILATRTETKQPSGRDGLDLIGSQGEWAAIAQEKIAAFVAAQGPQRAMAGLPLDG